MMDDMPMKPGQRKEKIMERVVDKDFFNGKRHSLLERESSLAQTMYRIAPRRDDTFRRVEMYLPSTYRWVGGCCVFSFFFFVFFFFVGVCGFFWWWCCVGGGGGGGGGAAATLYLFSMWRL
jgi:hypothetical protein